ncbi:beta-lactamase domain-containing protein 2-like [Diadema antillarum]|uniref:beta-lactamase domain-containing protein 2-like n=1 Tax=Diadema antillarum TaxID=105358 RepID=UPI003A859824
MSKFADAFLVLMVALCITYLPVLWRTQPPIVTDGFVAPGFEEVARTFRANFENGLDSRTDGSAFAAYYRGEKVVDIWGGYADVESQQKWKQDTVTMAFSSTKGVAAVCLAILVDRGLLDYDQTVATYWPEFAQKGKENITVRHLLGHKAGLVLSAPPGFTLETLRDVAKSGQLMAEAEPLWEVDGKTQGYHLFSYGPLTNELLRRVDSKHRTMGEFFRDEVAIPFGIDFYIGLPLEENYRTARLRVSDTSPLIQMWTGLASPKTRKMALHTIRSDLLKRALQNTGEAGQAKIFNNPENRALEIPSCTGFGRAESLAKFYGILAVGGTDPATNRTLLSPERIHDFVNGGTSTLDLTLGFHINFNLGFAVGKYDVSVGDSC